MKAKLIKSILLSYAIVGLLASHLIAYCMNSIGKDHSCRPSVETLDMNQFRGAPLLVLK
jgi:hypothetical protein